MRVLDRAPNLAHVLSPRVARMLVEPTRLDPVEALAALDELAFTLRRWPFRAELTPVVEAARGTLGLPLGDGVDGDAEVRYVPWPAARGTAVALERRGRGTTRAIVHVASGAPRTQRLDVLEAALIAIEAASPSREDHERLLRLVDDSERDDPRANSEAAVRFAVGCIERARAIAKAREVALAFLAGAGIAPIALAAGERFDPERHPASAFERRRVRGPADRVVATEATGFKDASGVVLARAVVAVGGG